MKEMFKGFSELWFPNSLSSAVWLLCTWEYEKPAHY